MLFNPWQIILSLAETRSGNDSAFRCFRYRAGRADDSCRSRAEGWGATEIDCLNAFARHFLKWSNTWLEDGFAPVRKNWLWRCYGLGEEIEVRLEGETLKGVFTDLDEDGALLLKTGDGERRITAGEVFFSADEPDSD